MARADDDDDALLWGGEVDDPTYLDGSPRSSAAPAVLVEPDEADDRQAAGAVTNPFFTYAYGLFGGVYALYVVGWVLSIQRDTFTAPDILSEIMYQLGEFLAIVSPVLWIGLSLWLTRAHRPVVRLLWLIIGVLLLAPWPFIVPSAGVAG